MEDVMSPVDVLWANPVTIRLTNGLERSFSSISDALDFLESEWPSRRGAYHDAAVVTCRNALKKMTPPTVAREYFSAACLEAGFGPKTGTRVGHAATGSFHAKAHSSHP
ncbi:DUF982 domain-containing protein [Rhizobium sp. Rhizsp42]|jgi:hypothetical protein|uniref:DUF982 domain-containing protein n=2 Tax=unclassified Rhizobium TaxID=2613769 RepID=UPI0039B0C88F